MEERKKESLSSNINKAVQPPYSRSHQQNNNSSTGQNDSQFSIFTQYFPFQLDSNIRSETPNQQTNNNFRAYFNPWEWGNSSSFINGISNSYNSNQQSFNDNSQLMSHAPITSTQSGNTQIAYPSSNESTYDSPLNYGAENLFGLKFWNQTDGTSNNPPLHSNIQQPAIQNNGINNSRDSSFFSQPSLMDWRVGNQGPLSETKYNKMDSKLTMERQEGAFSYDQMTNEDEEDMGDNALERLTGFGYSPSSVVTALQLSNNDEYEALAWLQNQSIPDSDPARAFTRNNRKYEIQTNPNENYQSIGTNSSNNNSSSNNSSSNNSSNNNSSSNNSSNNSNNTSSWKKLFENLTSNKLELSKELQHITHINKEEKAPKELPSDIDTTMICKFFLNGYCKNGKECPFLHDPRLLETKNEELKKFDLPCKFYAIGACKKGDKCPFIHESLKPEPKPVVMITSDVKLSKSTEGSSIDSEKKEVIEEKIETSVKTTKKVAKPEKVIETPTSIPTSNIYTAIDNSSSSSIAVLKELMENKRKKDNKKKAEKVDAGSNVPLTPAAVSVVEEKTVIRPVEEKTINNTSSDIPKPSKKEKKESKKEKKAPVPKEEPTIPKVSEPIKKEVTENTSDDDKMPNLVSDDEDLPETGSEVNGDISDDEKIPSLIVEEDETSDIEEQFKQYCLTVGDKSENSQNRRENRNAVTSSDQGFLTSLANTLGFGKRVDASTIRPYTPSQKEELSRLKKCKDHYEVLNVEKTVETKELVTQYRKLAFRFLPQEKGLNPPGVEEGFKAISLAFKILSSPVERFAYDLELIKGGGSIDLSDIDLPSYHIRSRPKWLRFIHSTVWTFSKILVLILGVFALAILFGLRIVRNLVTGFASFFGFNTPPQPKRQIKWCDNCKEYHNINLEAEGEIWEENGRYFLRKDGQILDITAQLSDYIQQHGLSLQEGDSDDSNSADEMDSKSHKGRKDKFSKKKAKVTKRK